MWIHPFWAGVASTIIIEVVAIVVAAIISMRRK